MTAGANREGFRILRSEPALFFMELLWRWSFGLGLLALLFFSYSHLRQLVLLPDVDVALSSQESLAFADATSRAIADAFPLMLPTLARVFTLAAVLWITASTLGRGIITRIIVRRLAVISRLSIARDAPRWAAFATLNFARVMMLLIVVIGYLGGAFIAGLVDDSSQSSPASALIIFASFAISSVVWSYVNWVLSLAPIFIVRDALSPLDSIVAAIAFLRRNRSRLAAIALWNSTVRGLAATGISIAGVCTVFAISSWASAALLGLETLLYLIVSDIFLVARLAAYASVAVRELASARELTASADPSGAAAL